MTVPKVTGDDFDSVRGIAHRGGLTARPDQEDHQVRSLLLAGASAKPAAVADAAYFSALRSKIGNGPRRTSR